MLRSENCAVGPRASRKREREQVRRFRMTVLIVARVYYVNKRPNTRPTLSKRDSVHVSFTTTPLPPPPRTPPFLSNVSFTNKPRARNKSPGVSVSLSQAVSAHPLYPLHAIHNRHKGRQHGAAIN